MENLTAIEKLDAMLGFFNQQSQAISKDTLTGHFKAEFELIVEVLDRLIADGFVKESITTLAMGVNYYFYLITFDGRFFYDNGGYKGQKEKEEAAVFYSQLKEKTAQRNERLLVRGTWAAAVVGLLVLAWQVFTYFYPGHP